MIKLIVKGKTCFNHKPVVHDHSIKTGRGVLVPEVMAVSGRDFRDLLGVQVEASSNTCCCVHLRILIKQNFIINNEIDIFVYDLVTGR